MSAGAAWDLLLAPPTEPEAREGYPIAAYSEFMPPPRLGVKPYGAIDPSAARRDDPWGWPISEYEEAFELRPGLAHLAELLLAVLQRLGQRHPAHGISRQKLRGNPYWPEELQDAGAPAHERYLVLLPLALSRTQDDKGRVRWTLFGGSEQGPSRGFWRGFFTAPGQEAPAEQALDFLRRMLAEVYGESSPDLRAAGLRILPAGAVPELPAWSEDPLPEWARPLLWSEQEPLRGVRYLLTFRAFARLPEKVRTAYRGGELHLLPFPGSMLFWGAAPYHALHRELPLALQVPLLHVFERSEDPQRLRVPQAGWMHEPHADMPVPVPGHGPLRATFRRTHRWGRVTRYDDELAVAGREDKIAHVLFSASAHEIGLYGKPMARNAQIWTRDYRLLLDGPRARRSQLVEAADRIAEGGMFGYRFVYPAMRVGRHELYWHRPLAAYLAPADPAAPAQPPPPGAPAGERGQARLLSGAPLGYLTAYRPEEPDLARPIELWPRVLARPPHLAAIEQLALAPVPAGAGAGAGKNAHRYRREVFNVRKLLDSWQLLGERPLDRGFARALLHLPKQGSLDAWLGGLQSRTAPDGGRPEGGRRAGEEALPAYLEALLAAPGARDGGARDGGARKGDGALEPEPLTFHQTARRRFEEAYWRHIAFLAGGRFVNKDNADCVRDAVTRKHLIRERRDLDALGDYLLDYYEKLLTPGHRRRGAAAGALPFQWRTDFNFPWSGGWLDNQEGRTEERDVVVVIPGRDRGRAVIMADHYDTAYMEDKYGYGNGGHGPRLAAAGADDNHSATAALMLGAPIFLELSRAGRLGCDVWLVHLTGEEFPSDCLGARYLTQRLVEGELQLRRGGGGRLGRKGQRGKRGERELAGGGGGAAGADGGTGATGAPGFTGAAERRGHWLDLSSTRIQGVYVLDMVAHNNDRHRDIFQICPGTGRDSLWLAWQAHLAGCAWNRRAPLWNRRWRRGCRRGRRSADGATLPRMALHPELHGEVRPAADPRSTLYNTDGQIFSDAGVPVVLFMEDYDINRHGYHDSHDTMENIDLDYGAAVAAIAIEAVARAATERPPPGPEARPAAEG
ncbi:MAG TPA: M28 family peptidase [Thermoanaerobaculia bacterium]|nr:M28 family peptidase [Thermoanaerobaculia bacterium]